MGVKVGASEVGVYLGAEKLAGVGEALSLESVSVAKQNGVYSSVYFDVRGINVIDVTAGTLPSGTTLHIAGGDNLTFDDGAQNSIAGTDIVTITSGATSSVNVQAFDYVCIVFFAQNELNARYLATGSCTVSGAQCVKVR